MEGGLAVPVLETLIGGGVFGLLTTVVEKIWPDKNKADEIKLKLFQAQQEGLFKELDADLQRDLAQIEVNKAEAQSGNWFAASWRPAIGWTCALSLAYNFLVYPVLSWAVVFWPDIKFPPQFTNGLFELVLGMLGIGTMRSIERIKGVIPGGK